MNKFILLFTIATGTTLIQADPTQNSISSEANAPLVATDSIIAQLTALQEKLTTDCDQLLTELNSYQASLTAYCANPDQANPTAETLLSSSRNYLNLFTELDHRIDNCTSLIITQLETLKASKAAKSGQQTDQGDPEDTNPVCNLIALAQTRQAELLTLLEAVEKIYGDACEIDERIYAAKTEARKALAWKWGKRAAIGAAVGVALIVTAKQIYTHTK
jgi:peptidoglycan hydrolase CwlO-like protein